MIRPLLQERHPQPWRVLVGCILLNRASGAVAIPIADKLFATWGSAESVAYRIKTRPDFDELVNLLRPLGFQHRRAERIVDLSIAWVELFGIRGVPPEDFDPRSLPGVGEYGDEAWRIFVLGERDFEPRDKVLAEYLREEKVGAKVH